MSDHDGHTIDVGPVAVGTCGCSNNFGHTCEEVARLRAENAALADALADIAGIYSEAGGGWSHPISECMSMDAVTCWELDPTDPDEWCSTCVAEVVWAAWRMGVLA